MVKTILEDKIYDAIYQFIKEHGVVKQPDIIKEFSKRLDYDLSKNTLNRMKIGNRLKRLEKAGLIEKKKMDSKGYIPANKWRVVQDEGRGEEGVSELSIEIPKI